MAELTRTELSAICSLLRTEQTLAARYQTDAENCEDPQLRTVCEETAARHRNHFEALLQLLSE